MIQVLATKAGPHKDRRRGNDRFVRMNERRRIRLKTLRVQPVRRRAFVVMARTLRENWSGRAATVFGLVVVFRRKWGDGVPQEQVTDVDDLPQFE